MYVLCFSNSCANSLQVSWCLFAFVCSALMVKSVRIFVDGDHPFFSQEIYSAHVQAVRFCIMLHGSFFLRNVMLHDCERHDANLAWQSLPLVTIGVPSIGPVFFPFLVFHFLVVFLLVLFAFSRSSSVFLYFILVFLCFLIGFLFFLHYIWFSLFLYLLSPVFCFSFCFFVDLSIFFPELMSTFFV